MIEVEHDDLPMGVELLQDEVIICNHGIDGGGGTVNFYNTRTGEMTLQLPGNQSQFGSYGAPGAPAPPKKFVGPACATGYDDEFYTCANLFPFKPSGFKNRDPDNLILNDVFLKMIILVGTFPTTKVLEYSSRL